jgi:ATP adenylyltransferase
MLNRFPYNGGHLLVLPLQHEGKIYNLSVDIHNDLMALTAKWSRILEKELRAQGLNVGINMGEAGGGGIPQHLHIHILPRWKSDTSFLPLLSDTKMVSVDLKAIYAQLKKCV